MIRRHCDVLGCEITTPEARPGVDWLRIEGVTHFNGHDPERRVLDACGLAHAVDLIDEFGEATDGEPT